MKVYICTDMEGISGIVVKEQVFPDMNRYEEGRRLLSREVNAAIQACFEAGAEDVLVNDGHGAGFNFVLDEMDPRARYRTGVVRADLTFGLDASFDAALLIGYHAMAGTPNAILEHTQSSITWYNYYVNGVKMGEIEQTAAVLAMFNIPVVFVSSDKAGCAEARKFLGKTVTTVKVKEGSGRTYGILLHPDKAHALIRKGVKKALAGIDACKPFKVKYPAKIRLEFQNVEAAERWSSGVKGIRRPDSRSVEWTARDATQIYRP
jgi:D-amino peptidase